MLEARTFTLGEREAQPHRVGNGQDVGKEDGGVERKARERLQRDFGGQRRIGGETHEAARLAAKRVVLGQIASRLAHEPHWRIGCGFAPQRAQEGVVLEHAWANKSGHEANVRAAIRFYGAGTSERPVSRSRIASGACCGS